jgi:RHS repeat-associated protein
MNRMTRAVLLALLTAFGIARFAVASEGQRYIVILKQHSSSSPDVVSLGGRIEFRQQDELIVLLPPGALDALRRDPAVKYVQKVGGTGDDGFLIGAPAEPSPQRPPDRLAVQAEARQPRTEGTITWDSGTYVYDGAGNITAIGTESYSYDKMQRLIQSTINGSTDMYVYDEFGNLTAKSAGGQSQTIPPVDRNTNQFSQFLTGYTYDVAGNVTSAAGWQFAYDAMSQPLGKTWQGANDAYYVYTAGDERVGVRENGWWTWSIRDEGGKVLRQYRSSASNPAVAALWLEDFVWRDGLLLGSERPVELGGRRHVHLDHLGTPRLITADNGQRVSYHDYYPFGDERSPVLQETAGGFDREDPMKYTGHERDFAGGQGREDSNYIDYMHARYYAAGIARFLSVDPIGGNPYRPQTWNRYSYALNNPLRYTDPTGMYPCMVKGSDGKEHPGECIDVVSHYDQDLAEWNYYKRNHDRNRLLRQARRGDDFAALQLNFNRELHHPLYTTNIEATHAEFAIVAPVTGFLRQLGVAGGEIGLKAAAEETESFFDGATFNLSGKLDAFHNFPESVMAFEDAGTVTTIPSAGGMTSQMLEIPGGYMGKEGVFQFIKTHLNEITHYLFKPTP